eukprot:SM001196S25554  [mRNA]  locus=s1196:154:2076:- [translate_table: standard]
MGGAAKKTKSTSQCGGPATGCSPPACFQPLLPELTTLQGRGTKRRRSPASAARRSRSATAAPGGPAAAMAAGGQVAESCSDLGGGGRRGAPPKRAWHGARIYDEERGAR